MRKPRKQAVGGGSKLSRSEILQFRLDPRTRFALELMAKCENRTVSSYIEKLVNQAMRVESIEIQKTYENDEEALNDTSDNDYESMTVHEALKKLWHIDEIRRFIATAMNAPYLFSYEEEVIWDFVKRASYYWYFYEAKTEDENGEPLGKGLVTLFNFDGANYDRLTGHWDLLKEHQFDEIKNLIKAEGKDLQDGEVIERPANEPALITILPFPWGYQKQENAKKNKNKQK